MSSLGGACEITVEDEASYSHQFKTLKTINCKVRVDARFEKIYGHADGFGRGALSEPVDLGSTPRPRGPPRQLGVVLQQKSALKKPIGVGSLPPSPVMGVSEAVTLKQALRKLCISQASEMAAMRRLSKPAGTSSISSEAGTTKQGVYASVVVQSNKPADKQKGSLFEISIIPQKIDPELDGQASGSADTCKVESLSSSKAGADTKAMKPRLKDVIASPLTDSGTKSPGETAKGKSKSRPRDYATLRIGDRSFKFCLTPRLTTKIKSPLQSKVNAEPAFQENKQVDLVTPDANKSDSVIDCGRALDGQQTSEGGGAKEKGESSQSSKSSTCEHSSSSTSVSDESSQSTSSGRGFSRPHTSKDSRWMAVQEAEMRQGGLSLDNFVLLKRLGCGDIGTVYLAELVGTDCLFALKVMDVDFLLSRKKMSRAQTEREILHILDHPFLPTLFTHFTTDNLSCLVMEYCPGGDLHVLRQRQPARCFSESAARFYVAEVLLALEYLHMLGVVYRDLKPENILVREDGHIMLSDFDLSLRCVVNPTLLRSSSVSGLGDSGRRSSSCVDPSCLHPSWVNVSCFAPGGSAKSAAAEGRRKATVAALPQLVVEPTGARSNSFVGTHEYLAPEIIKGDGHGSAVDWWTLGVFLYELLFGRTPFKGAVNEETLANVITQDLRFPASPGVSLHARSLVCGLLAKDPESRLGSLRGAAEIKQHPFFHGINWALIRSATPPETPLPPPPATAPMPHGKKAGGRLEFRAQDERIEFELF